MLDEQIDVALYMTISAAINIYISLTSRTDAILSIMKDDFIIENL
jgi:hypothetical protein